MSLKVPAINATDSANNVAVSEQIFGQPLNEALIHQLLTKYLANARSGTKAQKNRAAVSGGGAKPFRQKGNGRARAGTIRGPIWRKGGVTFAAQPRTYDKKINKKMFKVGIRSIFSELLRQNRLLVSNDIIPTSPKTRDMATKINAIDGRRILIIADDIYENLELASRNIANVAVITSRGLNPALLVGADKVIVTSTALKQVEEQLA